MISRNFPGLEKRQCSIQVVLHAEGKQSSISAIFWGKILWISQTEKYLYDEGAEVYCQPKAWAD